MFTDLSTAKQRASTVSPAGDITELFQKGSNANFGQSLQTDRRVVRITAQSLEQQMLRHRLTSADSAHKIRYVNINNFQPGFAH